MVRGFLGRSDSVSLMLGGRFPSTLLGGYCCVADLTVIVGISSMTSLRLVCQGVGVRLLCHEDRGGSVI